MLCGLCSRRVIGRAYVSCALPALGAPDVRPTGYFRQSVALQALENTVTHLSPQDKLSDQARHLHTRLRESDQAARCDQLDAAEVDPRG